MAATTMSTTTTMVLGGGSSVMTSLANYKISSVVIPMARKEKQSAELQAQQDDAEGPGVGVAEDDSSSSCQHISSLLTRLSYDEIDAGNPVMVDLGLLVVLGLFDHQPPEPLGRATTSELAGWWRNSLRQDRENTTAFLREVAAVCMSHACSSTRGIGEADIAGIGVHVANSMLAVLVVAFWFFGLVHSPGPAHRGMWPHECRRYRLCNAMRATVDDVFDGSLVFSISLHVATLSYQSAGDSTRYEVTFAQTSCTFAALSVVTLWHVRGDLTRARLHTRLFFCLMCGLALPVFVLRCLYHLYPTTFWDEACVEPSVEAWWHGGRQLMDFLSAAWFGMAILTSFLPLDRLLTRCYPDRVHTKAYYARKGLVSKLRFTQSFFGAGGIFVYMVVMNQSRRGFEDENNWGIGQYLAVATWVPSIVKMIYFLCTAGVEAGIEMGTGTGMVVTDMVTGMEKSLTSYLPLPWMATLPVLSSSSAPTVPTEVEQLEHEPPRDTRADEESRGEQQQHQL